MSRSQVTIDWFLEGVDYAQKQNNITIIVDTLRFSSATVTAVANGFEIYPVSDQDYGRELARKVGAELSGKPGQAKYSISPLSYLNCDEENRKVVLFSPNGAACSERILGNYYGLVGTLLNARAAGSLITKLAKRYDSDVTVIAAGEQRAIDDGHRVTYFKEESVRVFAIEDYLGAGAIISNIELPKTPEAQLCELACKAALKDIAALLRESFSGKFLIQHGMGNDFDHCVQTDIYDTVPMIHAGKISKFEEHTINEIHKNNKRTGK
ncbi:2-phosphosulfolactate phosphatase [bacterium]|nr:2-phosphosulfolactate phosphatase [bacterium]